MKVSGLKLSGLAAAGLFALFDSQAGLAQRPDWAGVEIVRFLPASGTMHPGDTAFSQLAIHNKRGRPVRVWIGYSMQDPTGQWFDVPSHVVVLAPGVTSLHAKKWRVPSDPPPAQGPYRVVMAVWSSRPDEAGASRLVGADRKAAFSVAWKGSLTEGPKGPWHATQHSLGRGKVRADHVLTSGTGFRLLMPASSCDGSEIRSTQRFSYGEYSARMLTPQAPGSISALFLYQGVSGENDEIDIEIYNDGSRRALLSAWVDGKISRNDNVILPFDPSAGYHDYAIRWLKRNLSFYADGIRIARWTSRYPRREMHVMANVWWPTWLACNPATAAVKELSIDRLTLSPAVRE